MRRFRNCLLSLLFAHSLVCQNAFAYPEMTTEKIQLLLGTVMVFGTCANGVNGIYQEHQAGTWGLYSKTASIAFVPSLFVNAFTSRNLPIPLDWISGITTAAFTSATFAGGVAGTYGVVSWGLNSL